MLKLIPGLIVCLSLVSCAGFSVTGGPGKVAPAALKAHTTVPSDLNRVSSLLVAPIDFDQNARDSLALSESFYKNLLDSMRSGGKLRVVSASEAGLSEGFSTGGMPPLRARAEAARRGGIDAFLVTTVQSYVEREGTPAAAETPATVSFVMRLYRSSDLKELWEASYYFQDQALSENLFRIEDRMRAGRGPGWRRADDVLLDGFKAACADLSGRR